MRVNSGQDLGPSSKWRFVRAWRAFCQAWREEESPGVDLVYARGALRGRGLTTQMCLAAATEPLAGERVLIVGRTQAHGRNLWEQVRRSRFTLFGFGEDGVKDPVYYDYAGAGRIVDRNRYHHVYIDHSVGYDLGVDRRSED